MGCVCLPEMRAWRAKLVDKRCCTDEETLNRGIMLRLLLSRRTLDQQSASNQLPAQLLIVESAQMSEEHW
jgi:hypothetical protein